MKKCGCTDNESKEKYVCTIFTVIIILYIYSWPNSFHNIMVFTIIVLLNTQEKRFKRKRVSKSAPQISVI